MAVHASITVVMNLLGNLKYKDRFFADKNESFSWEVANRSGMPLKQITVSNFKNAAGTSVPLNKLFQKLVPITTLPNNESASIKFKLKNDVDDGVYTFDVVHKTSGAFEVIADPEMEVCADITLLDVNFIAVPDVPPVPKKKRSAPKRKK
jgi:hypothetical protein